MISEWTEKTIKQLGKVVTGKTPSKSDSQYYEGGTFPFVSPKDLAKKFEADLIICGATGMNAVERFLIGSVSESITRYAKCDVLVIRS